MVVKVLPAAKGLQDRKELVGHQVQKGKRDESSPAPHTLLRHRDPQDHLDALVAWETPAYQEKTARTGLKVRRGLLDLLGP